MSDFGPKTAFKVVDVIREKIMAGKLQSGEQIRSELRASIAALLTERGGSTDLALGDAKPAVILVVGVNGGGKTTTIGKLAHRFAQVCQVATVKFPAAQGHEGRT